MLPNANGIFLGGHSYGAPSALLAAQQVRQPNSSDSSLVDGLILHDPALAVGYGLIELPPKLPTVSYTSDEYHRANIRCGTKGAFHGNFVDAPLWAPLWIMRALSLVIPACGPADPNLVHQQLAQSAKAFTKNPHDITGVEKSLFERVYNY